MTTIAVFVGSLRAESHNKLLAEALETMLPEGTTFDYVSLDMPLYNTDDEHVFPGNAQAAKDKVLAADGVLFLTPEYNRGYPGVLKNAIDWVSRPWGHSAFAGKPAAVAGVSVGPFGTSQAQQQLKNVLLYLDMKVMGQPEMYLDTNKIFDQDGAVLADAVQPLQHFIDSFVAHISK